MSTPTTQKDLERVQQRLAELKTLQNETHSGMTLSNQKELEEKEAALAGKASKARDSYANRIDRKLLVEKNPLFDEANLATPTCAYDVRSCYLHLLKLENAASKIVRDDPRLKPACEAAIEVAQTRLDALKVSNELRKHTAQEQHLPKEREDINAVITLLEEEERDLLKIQETEKRMVENHTSFAHNAFTLYGHSTSVEPSKTQTPSVDNQIPSKN